MSFIRAKEIPLSGRDLSCGDKVRQRVLQHLGKSGHSAMATGLKSLKHMPQFTKSDDGGITIKSPQTKVTCKFCDSQNTRKFGTYKGFQNYYCNDCHTKFTGTDALSHGRVSPVYIASALNEYYRGMSFHDIEDNIETQTDSDISHTAIIKWVNKYTNEAIRQTKELQPNVGDTWIADETYIRIDKSKDRVENPYDKSRSAKWVTSWDIIDADTRFLLASHLTSTRNKADAQALMEKAAQRAGKNLKVVVTDQLAAYLDGIELAFGSETKHKQGEPFTVENNTNFIERFHGSLKDRTKVMRAQKNRITLRAFIDGWLIEYNFFRPHMGIDNKTPAEAAGIKYDVKSWADVVGYKKEPIVKKLEPE
jgi:putative transposase